MLTSLFFEVMSPPLWVAALLILLSVGVLFVELRRIAAAAKTGTRGPRLVRPEDVIPPSELSYFFGVVNVLLQVAVVAKKPAYYTLLHFCKNSLYFILRIIDFGRSNETWYLAEFCYVVNLYTLLWVAICVAKSYFTALAWLKPMLDPLGPALFRVAYAWSMGPVALSVAQFQNSMVFHSSRHMIILGIHLGPPILCYCLRFYHVEVEREFPGVFHTGVSANEHEMSWSDSVNSLLLLPTAAYLVLWLIPYCLTQFVFLRGAISEQGQHTMTRDLPGLKDLPEGQRAISYSKVHCAASFLTFSLSQLWWRSQAASTVFLIALLLCSIWNGGKYYFKIIRKEAVAAAALKLAEQPLPTEARKND